ncbi:MAG: serine/threonine protein kinase, partial [Ktedonobacterales bacterium]
HDVGLVHGDLKPNNIFVRTAPGGQPLAALSDFGQAVLTGSAAALLARGAASQQPGGANHWPASQVLFAAPEQLRGETTPASDQYALAAIAYYLLTGGAPISGEGPGLLAAIQRQEVVAPTLRNAEVPAEIDTVLLRGLAKEPGSRFPTIALFAQAVDEALAAGVSVGSTSTTVQFSRLAGSTPGMLSPTAAQTVAARSGDQSREQGASAAAGRPLTPSGALNVPADTPPMINRRLAIVTAAALFVGILACALTFRAFQGAAILPHFNLSGQTVGNNPGPTPTANAAATATARAETAQWKAATASPPIFKDTLAKNDNHWATDGKTVFFAPDGLHIHKIGASPAIGVDAPGQLPKLDHSPIAATVAISFNSGNPGDLAGMRFFVTPNGAGSEDYYAFLISSEGRYEFWLHQDRTWTFLRSGYSNAFKLGHGQTNTLAVLADSTNRSAALFANGQFLVTVDLSTKGPISGNVGLVVVDGGVDATYTNLTVYTPAA